MSNITNTFNINDLTSSTDSSNQNTSTENPARSQKRQRTNLPNEKDKTLQGFNHSIGSTIRANANKLYTDNFYHKLNNTKKNSISNGLNSILDLTDHDKNEGSQRKLFSGEQWVQLNNLWNKKKEWQPLEIEVQQELKQIEMLAVGDIPAAYVKCLEYQMKYALTEKEAHFSVYASILDTGIIRKVEFLSFNGGNFKIVSDKNTDKEKNPEVIHQFDYSSRRLNQMKLPNNGYDNVKGDLILYVGVLLTDPKREMYQIALGGGDATEESNTDLKMDCLRITGTMIDYELVGPVKNHSMQALSYKASDVLLGHTYSAAIDTDVPEHMLALNVKTKLFYYPTSYGFQKFVFKESVTKKPTYRWSRDTTLEDLIQKYPTSKKDMKLTKQKEKMRYGKI